MKDAEIKIWRVEAVVVVAVVAVVEFVALVESVGNVKSNINPNL